ncbi:hypothetical protein DBR11_03350 [Pedobacter sp. HMWF019]|uniref:zeta toxin family protein n=1 Tax=Pedobacter sp. HMWF019 TaxID=2056856 RepID=UPI000D3AC031|nr:zeta toxin family protein [Pedobacter sp. HMWF019]PTT03049.1 hypothetical protein DBR11_03350 [Pedobacter sp. HMWF019]
MDYSKPTLFVISGPPGAGKSTFGKELLPDELKAVSPYNKDTLLIKILSQLVKTNEKSPETLMAGITAMETQLASDMKDAIKKKEHFVLETILSHPKHIDQLNTFASQKYQIHLAYMCLDNVKACDIRVQDRVKSGGHYVSPRTVHKIYDDNLKFVNILATKIDRLDLYDNTKMPKLLASFEKGIVLNATPEALNKTWIKKGLPQLSEKLKPYLKENHKTRLRQKL